MKRRGLLKFLLTETLAITLPDRSKLIPVSIRLTKQADANNWNYSGETGTDFLGKLASEFQTCNSGQNQSPINLEPPFTSDFGELELNYQDTPLVIVNNGRTIKVNYQPGSSLTLDGQVYELLQFHFHQPSEHLLSGKAFEMEAHFVHQNQITGNLVVLAIFMSEGQVSQAMETIWQQIPVSSNQESQVSILVFNALQLLPENISQYYRYQGSLTTPPCSENVTWLILKQPVEVSKLQIARFLEVIGNNARPVQALNHRILSESN